MARKLGVRFLHMIEGIGCLGNRQTLVVGGRAGALGVSVGGALPVQNIEPVAGGYLVTNRDYRGELLVLVSHTQVAYAILYDADAQQPLPEPGPNIGFDIYGAPISTAPVPMPPPVAQAPQATGIITDRMPDGSPRYVERGAGDMIYDRLLGQWQRKDPTPPIDLGHVRPPIDRTPAMNPEGLDAAVQNPQAYVQHLAGSEPDVMIPENQAVLPPRRPAPLPEPEIDPRDAMIAKMAAQLDAITAKQQRGAAQAAAMRAAKTAKKRGRPPKSNSTPTPEAEET